MANLQAQPSPSLQSVQRPVGIAWISQATLVEMTSEANKKTPSETGGVILGYWANKLTEVVITQATGPGPTAVHELRTFIPDSDYHETKISELYERSGRLITYLGDWHTHPSGYSDLSRRDRTTLKSISAHPAARAPVPLMAILVRKQDWNLHLWGLFPRRIFSFWRSRFLPFELRLY